jgi:cysteine synthase A
VAQQRTADPLPDVSHSAFTPHPIQGWTPDFIPWVGVRALQPPLGERGVRLQA